MLEMKTVKRKKNCEECQLCHEELIKDVIYG
jgi:hypothetical protein